VKQLFKIAKNKYFISTALLVFYVLLLHNTDLMSLTARKSRVKHLKVEIIQKKKKIEDLKIALSELENTTSLEKFAREKYYFKKDNEDLFILSDK